jgi:hypothetical protein
VRALTEMLRAKIMRMKPGEELSFFPLNDLDQIMLSHLSQKHTQLPDIDDNEHKSRSTDMRNNS